MIPFKPENIARRFWNSDSYSTVRQKKQLRLTVCVLQGCTWYDLSVEKAVVWGVKFCVVRLNYTIASHIRLLAIVVRQKYGFLSFWYDISPAFVQS